MKKKHLIALALTVCVIAGAAGGSLAFLTNQGSIKNDFKVANFNPDDPFDDPDDLFDIIIDEIETDPAENPTLDPDVRTEEGNTYPDILPGDTLIKDPTIKNVGQYDQYIRVYVKVSRAQEWLDALAKWKFKDAKKTGDVIPTTIFDGFNSKYVLDKVVRDVKNDEIYYVYYLNTILTPGSSEKLFESVTLPVQFDNDDMLSIESYSITIYGEAMQTEHVGNDAKSSFQGYWTKYNETDMLAALGGSI